MKRLEKLIRDMRKQLFPYHHEADIERGGSRWNVETGEYLSSWLAGQLRNCRKKNRCERRGRCAYYNYSDLSKRNYEICYEILIRMESGEITCEIEGGEGED
jgi:hypothetical protein